MSQRVDRPDVSWVLPQGKAGPFLGRPEMSVLLQAEGMHAGDEPGTGVARRPGPQHSLDDLLEFRLLTGEEVEVLGDLQGEEIMGIMEQCALEEAGRTLPFAVGP